MFNINMHSHFCFKYHLKNDKVDAGKKLRRKLERRWHKTKSLDDYNAYLLQCRRVQ